MRKWFYLCLFFGSYIWMALTGNEQFVIERGKALYHIIVHWFQEADVDFHFKQGKCPPKRQRSRRWG